MFFVLPGEGKIDIYCCFLIHSEILFERMIFHDEVI